MALLRMKTFASSTKRVVRQTTNSLEVMANVVLKTSHAASRPPVLPAVGKVRRVVALLWIVAAAIVPPKRVTWLNWGVPRAAQPLISFALLLVKVVDVVNLAQNAAVVFSEIFVAQVASAR